MEERLFRDAMGRFTTGITVVTNEINQEIKGMTVNAFMSVSLNPKLITVSIDEKASMYEQLQTCQKFGVSILSEQQKDLSSAFAKSSNDKKIASFDYLNGVPVLRGSLVTLCCRLNKVVKAGDHMLLIAEVEDIAINEQNPLIYFGSEYRNLTESV
jgi:flavin reductase (DIM6/NTAB) family NADH-FMN oxidoreductase RutF